MIQEKNNLIFLTELCARISAFYSRLHVVTNKWNVPEAQFWTRALPQLEQFQ